MALHSSSLTWKIPGMEEPGGLLPMGSQRVGHLLSDFTFTFHFHALEKEMATHSSVLAWRIPGMEEPGGLLPMESHRVRHDWSDLAVAVHFNSLIPKMLMFTLAISYVITSNLPWFMDLTFQVPMQYCSSQHQTLLPSPVTSTTGCCFCFGSISSFFLELFLHWSSVVYWAPTDLGISFFSVLSFCLFILFMRFSRQEYWSGLPFPSPVHHI